MHPPPPPPARFWGCIMIIHWNEDPFGPFFHLSSPPAVCGLFFFFFWLACQRGWWCAMAPTLCLGNWQIRGRKKVLDPPPPPTHYLFSDSRNFLGWRRLAALRTGVARIFQQGEGKTRERSDQVEWRGDRGSTLWVECQCAFEFKVWIPAAIKTEQLPL